MYIYAISYENSRNKIKEYSVSNSLDCNNVNEGTERRHRARTRNERREQKIQNIQNA